MTSNQPQMGDFDCCAARDRDIAEAVAHEREAIAGWVESHRANTFWETRDRDMATRIRDGVHHEGGE